MIDIMTTHTIEPGSRRHCAGCVKWRMSAPDEDGITAPHCTVFDEFLLQDQDQQLLRLRACREAEWKARAFCMMSEALDVLTQNINTFNKEKDRVCDELCPFGTFK